jgi:hypothetical protein
MADGTEGREGRGRRGRISLVRADVEDGDILDVEELLAWGAGHTEISSASGWRSGPEIFEGLEAGQAPAPYPIFLWFLVQAFFAWSRQGPGIFRAAGRKQGFACVRFSQLLVQVVQAFIFIGIREERSATRGRVEVWVVAGVLYGECSEISG